MVNAHEKRRSRRKYNRSEIPRIRWSSQLHHCFVEAVDSLGGQTKATPMRILRLMGVKGLTMSHVKSHLQMYRIMRNTAWNYHHPDSQKPKRRPTEEYSETTSKFIPRHNITTKSSPFDGAHSHESSYSGIFNSQIREVGQFKQLPWDEIDCELTLSSFGYKVQKESQEIGEWRSSHEFDECEKPPMSPTKSILDSTSNKSLVQESEANLELTISSKFCP